MFQIKNDCENLIISFSDSEISQKELAELQVFLNKIATTKKIAIDLGEVRVVCNSFFSLLREFAYVNRLSLYNISAEVNLLLFIMNYGQFVDLYVDKSDFEGSKRILVNRNFRFCNC